MLIVGHTFIYLRLALYICMMVLYIRYTWLYSSLVKRSDDVEENPGPNTKSFKAGQPATGTYTA